MHILRKTFASVTSWIFFTHIICCSVNYVKSTQTSHCRVLRNEILYAFHTSEIVQTSVLALTNWQLALEMLAKVKFSLKCEISKWTWMLDSVQLCSYFSMYCYFASSNTGLHCYDKLCKIDLNVGWHKMSCCWKGRFRRYQNWNAIVPQLELEIYIFSFENLI